MSQEQVPLSENCTEIRLEGSTLHALTPAENTTNGAPAPRKAASFPLDQVLGNVSGRLVWGFKGFSESARNITLDGTTLKAELRAEDGTWQADSFDLRDRLCGWNGVITAREVPVLVAIPKDAQSQFLDQFAEMLEKNPDAQVIASKNSADGTTTFVVKNIKAPAPSEPQDDSREVEYVVQTSDSEEGQFGYARAKFTTNADEDVIFMTTEAEAKASLFHVASSKGRPIEQVEADILSAKATASFGTTYAGADARVSLVEAKASIFDLSIGAGVETGIGIKDGSFETKVLGCGITIGQTTSISAFGSSFGINFGRLFG